MKLKKRSLYEFDWQLLRVNLDFRTAKSTIDSCAVVYNFVNEKKYSSKALYKAINLFSATAMGFNGQIVRFGPSEDMAKRLRIVQEARMCLSQFYNPLPEHFEVDDDHRVMELKNATMVELGQVYASLSKRMKGAKKRDYIVQRDELGEYIDMLETAMRERGGRV